MLMQPAARGFLGAAPSFPTFVGAGTLVMATHTGPNIYTVTPPFPSGVAQGDLLLLVIGDTQTFLGSFSFPWTSETSGPSATYLGIAFVSYDVATVPLPTVTVPDVNGFGIIFAYRASRAISITSFLAAPPASTNIAPTISVGANNSTVAQIVYGFQTEPSDLGPPTSSNPSGSVDRGFFLNQVTGVTTFTRQNAKLWDKKANSGDSIGGNSIALTSAPGNSYVSASFVIG